MNINEKMRLHLMTASYTNYRSEKNYRLSIMDEIHFLYKKEGILIIHRARSFSTYLKNSRSFLGGPVGPV